ncbi:hypothetical protein FB451DRAFT_361800 [Mycena latifolia]|nr:hypothetical protein FB451DRAFT_361800 [Mycena latifolia]
MKLERELSSANTRTLSPAALSLAPAWPSTSSAFFASPTSSLVPIFLPSPSHRVDARAAAPRPTRDDDYIKRPENAFILFRRKCCAERALSRSAPSTPSHFASSSSADPPSLA